MLYFDICHLDGKTKQEISKLYQRKDVTTHKSCYYLDKFAHHIKINFGLTIKEYCLRYLEDKWPTCPINGKDVGFNLCGKGIELAKFVANVNKEHSDKFRLSCEKMSRERVGDGNPMYGKAAWNSGLTVADERVAKAIHAAHSAPMTIERREKLRVSLNKRIKENGPIHSMPHSPETCEKLRQNTAKLWASGRFKRTSSIHIKMREFLQTLDLVEQFAEEHQIVYFSADFAFTESKVVIEVDGDYFHVNPLFYPNGPKTAVQRRNFGRDRAKNAFLTKLGWTILRFWECDINSEIYKEQLLCKLKELNLLKN